MAKLSIHIKRPGRLHKDLDVPKGDKISTSKLIAAKNSSDPALRKRANFAFNARKWNHG